MTALERIKKALEDVTVQGWTFDGPADNIIIWCGDDTRVCFMTSDGPAKAHAQFITACQPAAITELIATLESLQREIEELVERANEAVEAANALQVRAEAAEAEVKLLRDLVARNWSGSFWRSVNSDMANEVRTALASTGGEHNAE